MGESKKKDRIDDNEFISGQRGFKDAVKAQLNKGTIVVAAGNKAVGTLTEDSSIPVQQIVYISTAPWDRLFNALEREIRIPFVWARDPELSLWGKIWRIFIFAFFQQPFGTLFSLFRDIMDPLQDFEAIKLVRPDLIIQNSVWARIFHRAEVRANGSSKQRADLGGKSESIKLSMKGKSRTGVSRQALFQDFKEDLANLNPLVIERLRTTHHLGERRKILIEAQVRYVDEIDGKFLIQAIDEIVQIRRRDVQEPQQPSRAVNRLKFGGKGKHLKAYLGDDFDYIVKILLHSSAESSVRNLWLASGIPLARKKLKGYAAPTLVIDTQSGQKEFVYHLKDSDNRKAKFAILQPKYTRLIDKLKILTREQRFDEAQHILDQFKKCVIGMFRRGVIDSDVSGFIYNFGYHEKSGEVFVFDLGELIEGDDAPGRFFERMGDVNRYIENDFRDFSPELANNYAMNPLLIENFYDEELQSLYGVDYDEGNPDQFRMDFPISEEEIRNLFSNHSVHDSRTPQKRSATRAEVRAGNVKSEAGSVPLDFARGGGEPVEPKSGQNAGSSLFTFHSSLKVSVLKHLAQMLMALLSLSVDPRVQAAESVSVAGPVSLPQAIQNHTLEIHDGMTNLVSKSTFRSLSKIFEKQDALLHSLKLSASDSVSLLGLSGTAASIYQTYGIKVYGPDWAVTQAEKTFRHLPKSSLKGLSHVLTAPSTNRFDAMSREWGFRAEGQTGLYYLDHRGVLMSPTIEGGTLLPHELSHHFHRYILTASNPALNKTLVQAYLRDPYIFRKISPYAVLGPKMNKEREKLLWQYHPLSSETAVSTPLPRAGREKLESLVKNRSYAENIIFETYAEIAESWYKDPEDLFSDSDFDESGGFQTFLYHVSKMFIDEINDKKYIVLRFPKGIGNPAYRSSIHHQVDDYYWMALPDNVRRHYEEGKNDPNELFYWYFDFKQFYLDVIRDPSRSEMKKTGAPVSESTSVRVFKSSFSTQAHGLTGLLANSGRSEVRAGITAPQPTDQAITDSSRIEPVESGALVIDLKNYLKLLSRLKDRGILTGTVAYPFFGGDVFPAQFAPVVGLNNSRNSLKVILDAMRANPAYAAAGVDIEAIQKNMHREVVENLLVNDVLQAKLSKSAREGVPFTVILKGVRGWLEGYGWNQWLGQGKDIEKKVFQNVSAVLRPGDYVVLFDQDIQAFKKKFLQTGQYQFVFSEERKNSVTYQPSIQLRANVLSDDVIDFGVKVVVLKRIRSEVRLQNEDAVEFDPLKATQWEERLQTLLQQTFGRANQKTIQSALNVYRDYQQRVYIYDHQAYRSRALSLFFDEVMEKVKSNTDFAGHARVVFLKAGADPLKEPFAEWAYHVHGFPRERVHSVWATIDQLKAMEKDSDQAAYFLEYLWQEKVLTSETTHLVFVDTDTRQGSWGGTEILIYRTLMNSKTVQRANELFGHDFPVWNTSGGQHQLQMMYMLIGEMPIETEIRHHYTGIPGYSIEDYEQRLQPIQSAHLKVQRHWGTVDNFLKIQAAEDHFTFQNHQVNLAMKAPYDQPYQGDELLIRHFAERAALLLGVFLELHSRGINVDADLEQYFNSLREEINSARKLAFGPRSELRSASTLVPEFISFWLEDGSMHYMNATRKMIKIIRDQWPQMPLRFIVHSKDRAKLQEAFQSENGVMFYDMEKGRNPLGDYTFVFQSLSARVNHPWLKGKSYQVIPLHEMEPYKYLDADLPVNIPQVLQRFHLASEPLVFANIHQDEMLLVVETLLELLDKKIISPQRPAVIAPRYDHIVPQLLKELRGARIAFKLRKPVPGYTDPAEASVLVLNTYGELSDLLKAARLSIYGNTLLQWQNDGSMDKTSHNLAEAGPVITGDFSPNELNGAGISDDPRAPIGESMQSTMSVIHYMANEAVLCLGPKVTPEKLVDGIQELLSDPQKLETMRRGAQRAQAVLAKHARQRIIQVLNAWIARSEVRQSAPKLNSSRPALAAKPSAIMYLDGRELTKRSELRQEVFALASYGARMRDIRLVIYHAADLAEEFYRILSGLGNVRLVVGELGTVPAGLPAGRQGLSPLKEIFLVTSETESHPQGMEAFLLGDPLDLWAARLYALSDRAVEGVQKIDGLARVIGQTLRTMLADFRSQFVVRIAA